MQYLLSLLPRSFFFTLFLTFSLVLTGNISYQGSYEELLSSGVDLYSLLGTKGDKPQGISSEQAHEDAQVALMHQQQMHYVVNYGEDEEEEKTQSTKLIERFVKYSER